MLVPVSVLPNVSRPTHTQRPRRNTSRSTFHLNQPHQRPVHCQPLPSHPVANRLCPLLLLNLCTSSRNRSYAHSPFFSLQCSRLSRSIPTRWSRNPIWRTHVRPLGSRGKRQSRMLKSVTKLVKTSVEGLASDLKGIDDGEDELGLVRIRTKRYEIIVTPAIGSCWSYCRTRTSRRNSRRFSLCSIPLHTVSVLLPTKERKRADIADIYPIFSVLRVSFLCNLIFYSPHSHTQTHSYHMSFSLVLFYIPQLVYELLSRHSVSEYLC